MVELYNVMRGITLDSLGTWGGKIDGADLPFASWAAAMAKCDVLYPKVGGGTEPRFTAGLEVKVTDEPHEIAAALLDAASADNRRLRRHLESPRGRAWPARLLLHRCRHPGDPA